MNKLAIAVLALVGLSVSVPAQGRRADADRRGADRVATADRGARTVQRPTLRRGARQVVADNRGQRRTDSRSRRSSAAGRSNLIGSRRSQIDSRSNRRVDSRANRRSGRRATADRGGRFTLQIGSRSRGGYYETVSERVWVPGYYERVWRPAEYGFRFNSCGVRVRFIVRQGCYENVWCAGRYEVQTRRVWVPRSRGRSVICFD